MKIEQFRAQLPSSSYRCHERHLGFVPPQKEEKPTLSRSLKRKETEIFNYFSSKELSVGILNGAGEWD